VWDDGLEKVPSELGFVAGSQPPFSQLKGPFHSTSQPAPPGAAVDPGLYLATTNRLMGAAVNARPEQYDGIVWSPHLRTGILLARCNGRTFWTGMSTSATR